MHRFIMMSAAAAVLVAAARPAAANQPPGAAPGYGPVTTIEQDRQGWNLGFAVGAGEISCEGDGCDGVTEAGGVDFHAGYMINPRLAAIFDLWVMGHTEDRLTLTHNITTFGAQYWLTPRLWIKGGVGGAHARFRYNGVFVDVADRTETVPGFMAGVGYELMSSSTFALDVELKGGTGVYDEESAKAHNVALQVGFTWF